MIKKRAIYILDSRKLTSKRKYSNTSAFDADAIFESKLTRNEKRKRRREEKGERKMRGRKGRRKEEGEKGKMRKRKGRKE